MQKLIFISPLILVILTPILSEKITKKQGHANNEKIWTIKEDCVKSRKRGLPENPKGLGKT